MRQKCCRQRRVRRRDSGPGAARTLAVLAVLAAAAGGQWLETTVELPGATLGPSLPEVVAVSADKVYIGGGSGTGMLVLDAETMSRAGAVPGLTGVRALVWAPTVNKFYAARPDLSEVAVIDGATDSVIAAIPVGSRPVRLLGDEVRNVVYALSNNTGEIAVIDVALDSVVAVVPVPRHCFSLALDPVNRRLYCVNPGGQSVTVIDADADTVVAVVSVPGRPIAAACNPARRKIYVANQGTNSVDVIDAAADTLLGSIPDIYAPYAICYNPDDDKVYAGQVHVIDCASDNVIAELAGGASGNDAAYSPAAGKVYVSGGNQLWVVDGPSDEAVAVLSLPTAEKLAVDGLRNRVYCAQSSVGRVSAVDGATDELVREVRTWTGPLALAYDPAADRLYCADGAMEDLLVVDGATNRITGSVPLDRPALAVLAHPAAGKAYCATDDGTLAVYDAGLDSLVRRLALGFPAHLLELNPAANKLYAASRGGNRVAIIGCADDSVEAVIALGSQSEISALQAVPRWNEVYVASGPAGLLTVIDGRLNRVTAYIGVKDRPSALAYAPRVDRVYCPHFAYSGRGLVTVVDAELRAVIDSAVTGNYQLSMAAGDTARNMLYVAPGRSSTISVIDCELNRTVDTLLWEPGAGNMLVEPRFGRLYLAGATSNMVGVFDVETRRLLDNLVVGSGPLAMTWNPGHSRVYVACDLGRSIAVIRDSLAVGVAEEAPARPLTTMATVVRGILRLPDSASAPYYSLFDRTGRRLMELQPGENDVRHLSAGVYFIRAGRPPGQGAEGTSAKVVIQR